MVEKFSYNPTNQLKAMTINVLFVGKCFIFPTSFPTIRFIFLQNGIVENSYLNEDNLFNPTSYNFPTTFLQK